MDPFSAAFFNQQNLVRTQPSVIIQYLQDAFNDLTQPREVQAYLDGITAATTMWPAEQLTWSDGMALAARDHCDDIIQNGVWSHIGSDNSTPSERMQRYGTIIGISSEIVDGGALTAIEAVNGIFADPGDIVSHVHRRMMMSENYTVMGAAHCSAADRIGQTVIVLYAEDYVISREGQQRVDFEAH